MFGSLLLVSLLTGAALAQQVPELYVNQRRFADALTSSLYDPNATTTGDFTSALGVSMAFSLVYPSMTGTSLEQTQSVLGYPAANNSTNEELVWANATTQLVESYDGACLFPGYEGGCESSQPKVAISNVIWVDSSSTVDPEYAAVVGSSLEQIDFADAGAGGRVNEWVNNATNGLISELVQECPLTPMVILAVNAIYLKASWLSQFSASKTNQDAFYASASKTTPTSLEANFMHQVEFFPYSDQAVPGFQIVQIPFSDSRLSMVIAVPLNDDSGMVTSSDIVGTALSQLETERVALALPKFVIEMEYSESLENSLVSLGIVDPFASGGLCIFENDCSTVIDYIIQKTFIRADEDGVEAAAVTGIIGVVSAPTAQPIEVLADHPFQFFIFEQSTQLVLFEGRLDNPGLQQNTTELTARHSDADFWVNLGISTPVIVVTGSKNSTMPVPSTPSTTLGPLAPSPTETMTSTPTESMSPSFSMAPSSANSTGEAAKTSAPTPVTTPAPAGSTTRPLSTPTSSTSSRYMHSLLTTSLPAVVFAILLAHA